MISQALQPPAKTAISLPVVVLALIGIAVLGFSLGPAILYSTSPEAPRNDFLSFYAAPQLLLQGKLYDHAAEETLHRQLGWKPDQHKVAFIRPPFYAVLLLPLTLFDYRTAYIVWQLLSVAAWCISAFLWRHIGPRAVLLAFAWSLPAWFAWLRGQDVVFVFLLASIGATLFRRGWLLAAGLAFALCGIKWNLFIPFPVLFLAHRHYRTLAGFLTGCAILALISFVFAQPDWPTRYVHSVMLPSAAPNRTQMASVNSLLPPAWFSAPVEIALGFVIVFLGVCYRSASFKPSQSLASGLLAGILVSHHAYIYDCILAVPALLIAADSTTRFTRFVSTSLLIPPGIACLLYPPLSIGVQIALLYVGLRAAGSIWRVSASNQPSLTLLPGRNAHGRE